MGRLICTFVVRIWHKQVFSRRGSINNRPYCIVFMAIVHEQTNEFLFFTHWRKMTVSILFLVTGISLWGAVVSVGSLCTIYTAVVSEGKWSGVIVCVHRSFTLFRPTVQRERKASHTIWRGSCKRRLFMGNFYLQYQYTYLYFPIRHCPWNSINYIEQCNIYLFCRQIRFNIKKCCVIFK